MLFRAHFTTLVWGQEMSGGAVLTLALPAVFHVHQQVFCRRNVHVTRHHASSMRHLSFSGDASLV